MRRIIFIAIMCAATVVGCDRFPDLTIQVTANLAPNQSDCTVDADQDLVLLRGTYDLDAPEFDYNITPRIESYIFDNSTEIQAPTGNMEIYGFDITIKLPDGTALDFGESLPNPYFVTSNAVIPSNDAIGGVSKGVALAPAIPSSYRSAMVSAANAAGFNSIVIDIRANGKTSGGFNQQSPPFSWPIDFCEGCLGVECPDGADVGDGVGCFPGQDVWAWCSSVAPPGTTN
jgi:hypothetical protein